MKENHTHRLSGRGIQPGLRVKAGYRRPIILALGSNLGNRLHFLRLACQALQSHGIVIERTSRIYETSPLKDSRGGTYLNACLQVRTGLSPVELLHRCQEIERRFGRVRRERGDARPLDVDLIFFGRLSVSLPNLTLPHPEWHRRDFVLRALRDLGVPLFRLPPAMESRQYRLWLSNAEKCILSTYPQSLRVAHRPAWKIR